MIGTNSDFRPGAEISSVPLMGPACIGSLVRATVAFACGATVMVRPPFARKDALTPIASRTNTVSDRPADELFVILTAPWPAVLFAELSWIELTSARAPVELGFDAGLASLSAWPRDGADQPMPLTRGATPGRLPRNDGADAERDSTATLA